MSGILGNAVPGAGGGAYTIDNSLRTRASASAYLNRTPASAGNRQTWTWSAWVKRGSLGTSPTLFQSPGAGGFGVEGFIDFSSDNLRLRFDYNGGSQWQLVTSALYRDPSAWYHIVAVADTTNATSSSRLRLYVNGSQVTAFSTANYPSQNANGTLNQAYAHALCARTNPSDYFDGYITEVRFIDGQALTASSFGETNASTGVWQPKAYTGTYGTNGFYLKFSDIATTSGSNAGLGKDFSGNGNYWNTNNISVTSGVTYDAMTDSPTPKSSTVGNYCVMNPLMPATYGPSPNQKSNVTNGNLTISDAGGVYNSGGQGTISVTSGKFYWEYTLGSTAPQYNGTGISFISGWDNNQYGISYDPYAGGGTIRAFVNASPTTIQSSLGSVSSGDVIAVALDCDAQTVKWYKNNVQVGSTVTYTSYLPANSTTVWPAWWTANALGASANVNFGQRPFAYTPPTGFVALNTYNLPTPTIGATASSQANKYFTPLVYTGNGTNNRAITGVGFQPDLVWTKCRSTGYNNNIADVVRGANKTLYSNTTDAEATNNGAGYVSAFSSDGYTVTQGVDMNQVNANGDTYVSWNWKANGSGSTNTAGSITSTVSANTTAGFSIVTYSGNASVATVGHGLGATPKMIIVKQRNAAGNYFVVWFSGATNANQSLWLGATNSVLSTPNYWGGSTPTSSVFSVGNDSATNGSGSTYVAYCWSEIAGFSKLGTFTGNGSSDGPFIYCGFRPRFLLIRRSTNIANWVIWDAARAPYNQVKAQLFPNTSDSEDNTGECDFLSNGFKIRGTNGTWNGSGDTIIYAAFAESPFNYSLAR